MKIIIDLSTASLILPVFFLKDILQISQTPSKPLSQSLNWKVYVSWICFGAAIIFGFNFYYTSAKWVRMAWGKPVKYFFWKADNQFLEIVLDISFAGAGILFILGLAFILCFLISFTPS